MSNTPSKAEIEVLVKRHGATSYRNRADTQHPAYGFTEDGLNGLIDEVLAKWGTPAPVGVGEVAERYRNAIASACEGWTMPDGLRKHLETALWSQPTQAQAGEVPLTEGQIQDLLLCGNPTDEEIRLIRIGWDAANGIKGGQHVS